MEGLNGLPVISAFRVAANCLHRPEDIALMRKAMPNLTDLDARYNPLTDAKNYRTVMLRRLTRLVRLDDTLVSDAERAEAAGEGAAITSEMIKRNSFSLKRARWSLVGRRGESESWTTESGWEGRVEELVLDHLNIRKLNGLSALVNLRSLSLSDNDITAITGLEKCPLLEELVLEENRVTKIDGIGHLQHLRRLDLGKNCISRASSLDGLTALRQLSLEDNEIDSLAMFSCLSSLLELYLGNNKVSNLREVRIFVVLKRRHATPNPPLRFPSSRTFRSSSSSTSAATPLRPWPTTASTPSSTSAS